MGRSLGRVGGRGPEDLAAPRRRSCAPRSPSPTARPRARAPGSSSATAAGVTSASRSCSPGDQQAYGVAVRRQAGHRPRPAVPGRPGRLGRRDRDRARAEGQEAVALGEHVEPDQAGDVVGSAGVAATSRGGPTCTSRPSSSTQTTSARVSASIASWVTSSVTPSYDARWRASSTRRLAATPMSSPANGSSSSSSRGSVARARAIETRCAWPPDSWRGLAAGEVADAEPVEPLLGGPSRACRGRRRRCAGRRRRSPGRSGGGTAAGPGTPSRPPAPAPGSGIQERPSTRSSPAAGTSPATARRRDDLPAPLGPITATTWPRSAIAVACTRPGTVRSSSRPSWGAHGRVNHRLRSRASTPIETTSSTMLTVRATSGSDWSSV